MESTTVESTTVRLTWPLADRIYAVRRALQQAQVLEEGRTEYDKPVEDAVTLLVRLERVLLGYDGVGTADDDYDGEGDDDVMS